jgi:hypothetical protein
MIAPHLGVLAEIVDIPLGGDILRLNQRPCKHFIVHHPGKAQSMERCPNCALSSGMALFVSLVAVAVIMCTRRAQGCADLFGSDPTNRFD